MSVNPELCVGAKEATRISEYMSETIAMLEGEIPESSEKVATIREYMASRNAGFLEDANLDPEAVSYLCQFDCSKCLGRVVLSVHGDMATIDLPNECPNNETGSVTAISFEEALRQARDIS